jgi:phosphohistidine phosphatase
VRAYQTWEIAREAMKDAIGKKAPQPQVDFVPELYGAEPTQLLEIIRMAEVADPERLMLIGHNPGMHELALMLTGSGEASAKKALEDNLPTAGLAIIDFATDDWSEVAFRRGKLARFTSPKLLKQALDE